MAFTKTPMQDTYQTKQVPLLYPWETRTPNNAKDTDALNVIFEPVKDNLTGDSYYEVLSRDGMSIYLDLTPYIGPGVTIIGAYYWPYAPAYVVVTSANIIFFDATTKGVLNSVINVITPDSQASFAEFTYDNGKVVLVINTLGKYGYFDQNGVWTNVLIGPAPPVANGVPIVFMDGYIFIMGGGRDIYNSNLNDPATFNASNFITTEAYSDSIVSLNRSGTYIVALKQTSIEYFYDAGNPTGSPLSSVQSATKRVGCIGGIAQYQDLIFFVGQDQDGSKSIYVLDKLSVTPISSPVVSRWLGLGKTPPAIQTITKPFYDGQIISINGHTMYVIRHADTPFTYAYDLTTKEWTRISALGETNLNIVSSQFNANYIGGVRQAEVSIMAHSINRIVYYFDPNVSQDNGIPIQCQFTTRTLDYGTRRLKYGNRLLFHTDQSTTGATMTVSWSINDYQTFSTPRTVNLASTYPVLYQAPGLFRKIAFKIQYSANEHMRWKLIEQDYNQGDA